MNFQQVHAGATEEINLGCRVRHYDGDPHLTATRNRSKDNKGLTV